MYYTNTIFNQLLSFLSKDKFQAFVGQHEGDTDTHVLADELVLVGEYEGMKKYPERLRRIRYYDEETKKEYTYLTNNVELTARQIAHIYKERWAIELY